MSTRTEKLESLHKSYVTMLEMLKMRGYNVPADYDMNYQEFLEFFKSENYLLTKLTDVFHKKDEDNKGVATFWLVEMRAQQLPELTYKMEELKVNRSIVVVEGKMTPTASSGIRSLKAKSVFIEVFTEKETQYNIFKHSLVPLHTICSSKEKKEILAKYGVAKDQLPHILASEATCRFLGAKSGQLIKIVKKSTTMPSIGGEDVNVITYRTVVNG